MICASARCFNTRARARRAPIECPANRRMPAASTHVPARGGHAPAPPKNSPPRRFNTRARARRALRPSPRRCRRIAASTHVPARGGHAEIFPWFIAADASTHVPARGGHPHVIAPLSAHRSFNTRARARRAHQRSRQGRTGWVRFNTRARARRALARPVFGIALARASTHVPARGGHLSGSPLCCNYSVLQHTCPREAGTAAR